MLTTTRRGLAALFLGAALLPAMAHAEAEKIKVGLLSLTSHAPSIIAEKRGYFDAEGLDVEFVTFQAAQPMAVAIASGDVDFGVTAITGGLISLADKGAVKVIGGALQESAEVPGQVLLASKTAFDAGLTSPGELAGKRFGVTTAGSSFHYMAHKAADAAGVARDELVIVPLNAVPAVIAALKSGQIDAWAIVPNIAGGLVKSGAAVEIGRIGDYIENYQVTTIFTSSDIAQNRPETAKHFIAAFARGAEDYNKALVLKETDEADIAEITAMVHEYVYSDRPYADADPAIRAGAMLISPGARLNMGSVSDQLDWFKSEGLVPEGVTIDTLVDTSFVETD